MPAPRIKPRTVKDRAAAALWAQDLGLRRYEQGVVRDVLALLEEADRDLERQLARMLAEGRSREAIARLRSMRGELRRATVEAYEALGEELTATLAKLAKRTAPAAARAVEGVLPFAFHMTRPDPGLLEAIVTRNPFQGRLLGDHVRHLADNRLAELTRVIQLGLVQGQTTPQITRRVLGTEAAGFADGALGLSRHQAAALTRTAVQHVHAEARQALFDENLDVVSGVMAVVTLDERTCRICGPRDGLVWRLPGFEPAGHEVAWDGGPGQWHFQCRCSRIAVLSDLEAFERLGVDASDLGTGERAAFDGPVSVDVDYEEWLRDAPREVRVNALGAARAEWWEGHPKTSLSRAWAKRFGGHPLTPAELDEILPN